MIRAIWAALACAFLAGCVSTSALEPQGAARSAQRARIYLIFPDSWAGKFARYNIEIDDKPVGKLAAGSYISVDRPAGRHKIAIKWLISVADVAHEFHAVAGRNYYFVFNIKSSTSAVVSGGFVMAIPMPGTSVGRPVTERNSMAGVYISQLDDAAGQAILAQLTKPQ